MTNVDVLVGTEPNEATMTLVDSVDLTNYYHDYVIITVVPNVLGRYVRIKAVGINVDLSLCEVEVYGNPGMFVRNRGL